jgi:hypothetical protein
MGKEKEVLKHYSVIFKTLLFCLSTWTVAFYEKQIFSIINLLKIFVLSRTLNIPEEAQKLAEKHDFEIQAYKFGTIFNEQLRTPR